jgi:tRNA-2-methylthio-N6-dimethylallyladenosine synthase
MDEQVPAEVMDERLQRLQALISEKSLAFNRATIGKRTSVLIERQGRRPGQMLGKSPWLQSVHVETEAKIGEALPNSLAGRMLSLQPTAVAA